MPKWVVNYADTFCILSRELAEGQPGIAVRTRPLTDEQDLLIMLPTTGAADFSGKGRISSGAWIGNERWIATGEPRGRGQKFVDTHIFTDELAKVASGPSMHVTIPNRLAVDVPLTGFGKALAALRTCEGHLARKWQVEKGWVVPPVLKVGWYRLFSRRDYPGWAADRKKEGKVRALLAIDAAGQTKGCTVIESSGFAAFDKRTCDVFLKRATFSPALDVNRKPIASKLVTPLVTYYLMTQQW